MDENYLDSLLKGVSNDKKTNKSFDSEVNMDAGIDIDLTDLDDISLDELDELDNMELGDLDVDDIDFDDIDVTNINPEQVAASHPETVEEEDFSLEELLHDEADAAEETYEDANEEEIRDMDIDDLFSALGIENEEEASDTPENAETYDFDELFNSISEKNIDDELMDIMDLDDIDTARKKDVEKTHKKKTFSEIVFGEPDADDEQEELLYQQKKAEKKEKRLAAKEAKKAAKQENDQQKKQETKAKEQLKLKKKKEKEEAYRQELEEDKDEKKISNLTVFIVFAIFVALAVVVVLGTKEFGYRQVIKKATDYFERDRYSLAYDEVAGVDVKKEDEDLRDRIYTVMYVERLYESYENNMSMGRSDKALDALLRGLEKYDVHYAEAVELNIVEDIELCKQKIIIALSMNFGLTEDEAYEIMKLEGQEYSRALDMYSEYANMGE